MGDSGKKVICKTADVGIASFKKIRLSVIILKGCRGCKGEKTLVSLGEDDPAFADHNFSVYAATL